MGCSVSWWVARWLSGLVQNDLQVVLIDLQVAQNEVKVVQNDVQAAQKDVQVAQNMCKWLKTL